MEAFNSYIPANCVRVSFELGERWFIADFRTDRLWSELDRFALVGALASDHAREAARRGDTRGVCLAGLWIVFHRPPDAQAARTFLVETVERDGRAWIGISADENATVDSVAFDIAPAYLAEPDTDLDAIEILPAIGLVH
jgi:hypothetical protein